MNAGFLDRCQTKMIGGELTVECDSRRTASAMWDNRLRYFAFLLYFEQVRRVRLTVCGRMVRPPINVTTLEKEMRIKATSELNYRSVLDMAKESDRSVCVVNQQTSTCLLVNEGWSNPLLLGKPAQYIGLNFLWHWRDTMDIFEDLQRRLRQDGKAEDFVEQLRRVDGSLCEYRKSYYIVPDFLGHPARMSVAHPDDWKVVESAKSLEGASPVLSGQRR